MGRPSEFGQAVADRICELLADGQSLREICEADGMPHRATVFRWCATIPEFRDQYARACEARADAIFDDMLSIADDGTNDWMEKRDREGNVMGWVENGETARRSNLRVEARKYVLARMQPKKYGERLALDHSGEVKIERPDFSGLPKEERDVLRLLLEKAEASRADEDAGKGPA